MPLTKVKEHKIYAYLAAFVWPFFGLFFAMFNFKASYAKNLLWIFCAFFGYTFIIASEGIDANRYRTYLERMYDRNNEPYLDLLVEPYLTANRKNTSVDVFSHTITTSVSRFTNDFRIFYGIVGFIFGYFYSRILFFVVKHLKYGKLIALAGFFLVVIALINPFWNINGYRFYTASHIFVLSVLQILYAKKRSYLWVLLLSPLVHFSFMLPVALVIVYYFIPKNIWMLVALLVTSLFFVNLTPQVVYENRDLAPKFMEKKVKSYTGEVYVESVQDSKLGLNWYVQGSQTALLFCLYIFIGIAIVKHQQLLKDPRTKSLFIFGLLLLAVANMFSSIPSMGRFYGVAALILFISFVFIIQAQPHLKLFKQLTYILIVPVMLFIVVSVRMGFDYIGLNSLFLNPFIAPFFEDSPVLIDFIKGGR